MNESYQQPGRWHDVILTPAQRKASAEPSEHIMSFHLHGLQPSSVYEAIVQAKNRYGWNEVSRDFLLFVSLKTWRSFLRSHSPSLGWSRSRNSFVTDDGAIFKLNSLLIAVAFQFPFPAAVAVQVSDIFQFYTQRSHTDPRVDGMEHVAMSTTRDSGANQLTRPALLSVVMALGIVYLLVPRTLV